MARCFQCKKNTAYSQYNGRCEDCWIEMQSIAIREDISDECFESGVEIIDTTPAGCSYLGRGKFRHLPKSMGKKI